MHGHLFGQGFFLSRTDRDDPREHGLFRGGEGLAVPKTEQRLARDVQGGHGQIKAPGGLQHGPVHYSDRKSVV